MNLGISVTNFSWPCPDDEVGPRVASIAEAADAAGFDSIWTMDHFFQIRLSGLPPEARMLEAYATLAFIAGHTRRIRLGTLVTAVPFRHPGALIKAVTSLDVLSGGRVIFGVGTGGLTTQRMATIAPRDNEALALGIPYPPMTERYERLEELLRIAHQMWRGDESPFEGRHYHLVRPMNSPNSLQRPHPPILIGGSGERRTLRLVAQYADACNLFDIPGSEFRDGLGQKLDVLRRHCRDVGRDYDEIEKTTVSFFERSDDLAADADRLLAHLRDLAAIGIDHVILGGMRAWEDDELAAVASLLPEVHRIPTAAAAA